MESLKNLKILWELNTPSEKKKEKLIPIGYGVGVQPCSACSPLRSPWRTRKLLQQPTGVRALVGLLVSLRVGADAPLDPTSQ